MSISINSDCTLLLYTDDSTIMYSHKNPEFIFQKLEKELVSCSEWLINKKFSLHLANTEDILLGRERKLKTITDFHINFYGHLIGSQRNMKYSGIDRYQNVSGERTSNTIIKKVNSRLRFMH